MYTFECRKHLKNFIHIIILHISKIWGYKNRNKYISIFNCNFWLKILNLSTKIGTFDPLFNLANLASKISRDLISQIKIESREISRDWWTVKLMHSGAFFIFSYNQRRGFYIKYVLLFGPLFHVYLDFGIKKEEMASCS